MTGHFEAEFGRRYGQCSMGNAMDEALEATMGDAMNYSIEDWSVFTEEYFRTWVVT